MIKRLFTSKKEKDHIVYTRHYQMEMEEMLTYLEDLEKDLKAINQLSRGLRDEIKCCKAFIELTNKE